MRNGKERNEIFDCRLTILNFRCLLIAGFLIQKSAIVNQKS
jgi:hypothetical protein